MKHSTEEKYAAEVFKYQEQEYLILMPVWIAHNTSKIERDSIVHDAFQGQQDKTVYWLEETPWSHPLAESNNWKCRVFVVSALHEKQFVQQNLPELEKKFGSRGNFNGSFKRFRKARGKSFSQQIGKKIRRP